MSAQRPPPAAGASLVAGFLKGAAMLTIVGGIVLMGLFWGQTEEWAATEEDVQAFRIGYVAGGIASSLLVASVLAAMGYALDLLVDQARTLRRVEDGIDELVDSA